MKQNKTQNRRSQISFEYIVLLSIVIFIGLLIVVAMNQSRGIWENVNTVMDLNELASEPVGLQGLTVTQGFVRFEFINNNDQVINITSVAINGTSKDPLGATVIPPSGIGDVWLYNISHGAAARGSFTVDVAYTTLPLGTQYTEDYDEQFIGFIVGDAPTVTQGEPVADNLTMYYSFDATGWNGTNDIANDPIGANDYGGYRGDANLTTSGLGSGANFDGVNDSINFVYNGRWDMSSNNMTISLWAYPTNIGVPSFQWLYNKWSTYYSLYITPTEILRFKIYNGSAYFADYDDFLPEYSNKWVHITTVFNGTLLLYFDGQLVASTESGGSILNTAREFEIGGYSFYDDGRDFNGTIDEFYIWKRALSPNEVKSLYDRSKGYFSN